MFDQREELERFKRDIDLVRYAEAAGYELDRKASSRSSAALRHPNGDKVIIAREEAGHWVYFSVRDDQDQGTIIDFVQRRCGLSLGEVRKELRPWIGASPSRPLTTLGPGLALPFLRPSPPKDREQVRARFEAMQPIAGHHAYLETVRGIPPEMLEHPRFEDCIRVDDRGNAVFPHWDQDSLCGYELKNQGFTGFAPGGQKGLWLSNSTEADTALVVTESAIDALSHFAVRRPTACRYASIAGTLNHSQPDLIRHAATTLHAGSSIIIATDNDPGGDALAVTLHALLEPLGPQIRIAEDRPATRGMDWNDVLRASGHRAGR